MPITIASERDDGSWGRNNQEGQRTNSKGNKTCRKKSRAVKEISTQRKKKEKQTEERRYIFLNWGAVGRRPVENGGEFGREKLPMPYKKSEESNV